MLFFLPGFHDEFQNLGSVTELYNLYYWKIIPSVPQQFGKALDWTLICVVKVGELEQKVEYLSCHFFLAVHVPDCLSVDICMNDSPQDCLCTLDFYIEAPPSLAVVATLLQ